MQIIQERTHHEETTYYLGFYWEEDPGAGFSFNCDENGKVDFTNRPEALHNYEMCVKGKDRKGNRILSCGLQRSYRQWAEPAIGKCVCGAEVYLEGFTCPCDCGRDYNSSGQELALVNAGEKKLENTPQISGGYNR